jgi:hypothetical protein
MKLHSVINFRMVVPTLCVIGLAATAVVPAQADQWDKKTILTVDQPIQVTETLLEPGQYVLKLANSDSDRHIVQIFNSDQTRIIGPGGLHYSERRSPGPVGRERERPGGRLCFGALRG